MFDIKKAIFILVVCYIYMITSKINIKAKSINSLKTLEQVINDVRYSNINSVIKIPTIITIIKVFVIILITFKFYLSNFRSS